MVWAERVKIGNYRDLRLAKALLEAAGLVEEVEIEAAPGMLTSPTLKPYKRCLRRRGCCSLSSWSPR